MMSSGGRDAANGPVVAIINSNDDLVEALRETLLDEGYSIVTAHIREFKSGRQAFGEFVTRHRPAIIIYDIAVPYEDNWRFFQTLRSLPECARQRFLVTTVNKRVMDERIGQTDVIEIHGGHAQDFDAIVQALRERIP